MRDRHMFKYKNANLKVLSYLPWPK